MMYRCDERPPRLCLSQVIRLVLCDVGTVDVRGFLWSNLICRSRLAWRMVAAAG